MEIEIGYGPDVKKFSVGGLWCIWTTTSALVLFLTFEIESGDGPGPTLDNRSFSHIMLFHAETRLLNIFDNFSLLIIMINS